jgi:1-acyl-sn-glycerol-3-phosphate acyltransferase
MWSVVCVFVVVFGFFWAWLRSRLSWMDFMIQRGVFVYCRLLHRWSANRRNAYPRSGPALIVCNHTCSADGTFILATSDRPISVLVASEHFNIHPLAHAILAHLCCVPIVRTGPDPLGLRRALARLRAGALVCVFPEGNLSGVALNRRRRPQPGAAYLALVSRVPVFPVHIAGGPHTHKLLASWVRPSPRAVRMTIGQPIDLNAYYDRPRTRRLVEEVSSLLMTKIAELAR